MQMARVQNEELRSSAAETQAGTQSGSNAIWLVGALWMAALGVATAGLLLVRARISVAHVAIAYFLMVLVASAVHGRRVGLLLATACFLAFNFFFVVPYGTFSVHDPLDWIVLLAFLATSAIAAQLLHRAQTAANVAQTRAREMERLAALAAEALQAPRAENAAVAIARVIRQELGMEVCELYLRETEGDRLKLVARASSHGSEEFSGNPDSNRSAAEVILAADVRTLLVPLEVTSRQVGILRLQANEPIQLHIAEHAFAKALAHYAALGLERVRLSAMAEHANALREADRLKDAVLSAVSHDLRTPLTAIKATARQIADDGDSRATIVEAEADRLNQYVTNLLDLSRLKAGAFPVAIDLVPIEDLLGAVLQHVTAVSEGRDIQVSIDEDESVLIGRLDFVLTLRALSNILENALRYSPDSACVEVRGFRKSEWVYIEIADRGAGIPKEDEQKVFEPFQRGTTAGNSAGVGLGLPIARRLIEAQGGTLSFAPRDGGGAIFTARLPAAEVGALEGTPL